jgi:hypothetical protein
LPAKTSQCDPVTVAAIGATVYFLSTLIHEVVGHGTVCLIYGGQVTAITAEYLSCTGEISSAGLRVLRAGGSVANILVGVAALSIMKSLRPGWPRLFAWLLGVVNLLVASGYIMVAAPLGMGDWGAFFNDLPGESALPFAAGGLALLASVAIARSAARRLWQVGMAPPFKRTLLWAYLAGSSMATLAGMLMHGQIFAVTAAAASFAATCWLVVYIPRRALEVRPKEEAPTVAQARSPVLIAIGVASAIAFLIMGHGVTLSSPPKALCFIDRTR